MSGRLVMQLVGQQARPIQAMAAVLICCLSCTGILRAQEAGAADPSPEIGPPANEAASADESELVRIQDENGEWRAVPYTDQELRASLLDQFAPPDESPIAPVYISELSLEGFVVDDRVHLTATIAIEVTVEGAAFDVPLRLNQAHVHSVDRVGPGRASPILDAQRDDGLHWRFEGQGTHRLELAFWVPLRTSPAGHQLLLTLPALPDYLVTRIRLKIPGNQLILRRPAEVVDLQQEVGEDGTTEVVAEVEGQRLELTWTERRETADTLSSVHTWVALQRDNEQLLLVGRQEISVEQGEVSEVLLRMPPEFTAQDVSLAGPADATAVMYEPLLEDAGWLRVLLPEPVHQRFTLTWTLQRPFPDEGGPIRIDGLEIANAVSAQGEILIDTIDGFTVTWNESRSRGVRRVSLRDEPARGPAWGEFKFENPPFQLEIDLHPIVPKTDAEVAYYLRVDADGLSLTLDVSVQILTGSVRELQFVWPDQIEERWSIADRQIQVVSNSDTVPAEYDGEQALLTLVRPVSATLDARLRFTREFPAGQSGIDLTLPRIDATWPARPTLFVGEAIDVTAELTEQPNLRSLIDPTGETLESLPAEFADDRVRGWEFIDNDMSLHVERTRHQRSVTVETSVMVGSPDDPVLQVVTDFAYKVEYGRIETMLFEVPEQLRKVYGPGTEEIGIRGAGLRFFSDDGMPLESSIDDSHFTVSLEEPRHGSFAIRLEYALPLSPSTPGSREEYQLPIVQPLDADVTRTAVHADPTSTLDVIVLDPTWQSIPHFTGGNVWYVAGSREESPLELRFAAREFAQRLRIQECFLQTAIDEDGSARTFGVYVLEDPPAEILISLPRGHSEFEFRWNDEPLAPARDSENAPYILSLPETAKSAESGRLVVIYQVDAAANSPAIAQASVEFPSFGPDVRIDETIWEVVLSHQHLLSGIPETMMPEFNWQRKSVLWMRSETEYVVDRRGEILGTLADELPSSTHTGNRYAFSTTGTVSEVRVESMTQALVVLIGAGLTMLLGFVFRRFPGARCVYSLLVLAFLFSFAAVWYLDLMQLLIQPALIGLGLALLAVKFDTATRTGSVFRKVEASSEEVVSEASEKVSSVPSAVSSGVARTALYRAANSSESGSGPHD